MDDEFDEEWYKEIERGQSPPTYDKIFVALLAFMVIVAGVLHYL